MKPFARKVYRRVSLTGLSILLALSSIGTAVPLFLSQTAGAISPSEVVYNSLPSVTPQTNYPSLGYEATSTSEFGDSIHLGGSNRILDTVTVTLSDWAKYSDYSSNATYSGNSSTWSMPITLNVYSSHLGANGAPDTLLATKTQTFSIPWRPESDPNCAATSNGNGWSVDGTCLNFSGIASNVTFDLSDLATTLPSDVILGVAYNTQDHGYAPTGVAGPYNSLNVAVPDNQPVTVGSDDNTDNVFLNTSYAGFYTDGGASGTNIFRQDTNWTPNGTVAFEITATTLAAPTIISPVNNTYTNDPAFTNVWDTVQGAAKYEYQTSNTVTGGGDLGTIIYADNSTSSNYDVTPTIVTRHNNGTPEGHYYWQVRAVDADGNPGDWSPVNEVTVDTTAPTGLANVSPADGTHTTTANQQQITWTNVTDASPVSYYYESSNSSATNPDGSFVNPVYQSAALSTNQIPTANTPAGTYFWHVRAVDAAGNSTAWTGAWKIVVDNTAPTATLSFGTPGPATTGFSVQFSEPVNATDATDPANYFLNNWPGAGGSGPLTGNATVSYDPTTYVATVSFTNPAWYISAEQQWGVENIHDLAGNLLTTNPTTAYSTPLVDPNAPGTPTTANPSNTQNIIWTWTAATDPGGVNASGVKGYNYSLTQGSTVISSGFTSATTLATTVPADGDYSLTVTTVDNAGLSSDSSTGNVTVDTVPPTVTVDPLSTTSTTPTITGTIGADAVNLVVTIDGAPLVATITGTTWSAPVTTALTPGNHTVVATATDAATNFTTVSQPLTVNQVVTPATNTTPATTVTTTTTTGTPTTTTGTGTTTPAADTAVLGTSTQKNDGVSGTTSNVKGASTKKSTSDGNLWGLAWYWWLIILAAAAGIVWWIIAAARRSTDQV